MGSEDAGQGGPHYIIRFEDGAGADHSILGGKCAGLAALVAAGAAVPSGFAITTAAYADMLAAGGLGDRIAALAGRLAETDAAGSERTARDIQGLIAVQPVPQNVARAIGESYAALCARAGRELPVAVRSSATAEDLPEASFAGVGDTYLWTVGAQAVVARVRDCWASLFSARAIAYRAKHGFGQLDHRMAVAVQTMVDAKAAGVAMTLDPANGDRSTIVVESIWGLGEPLVSGHVTPDLFAVDKVMLQPVKRTVVPKVRELVADVAARRTVLREVEAARRTAPSLTDAELRAVARAAKKVEQATGVPMDIEWAIDPNRPEDEGVVLLQARPETVWSNRSAPKAAKTYAPGTAGVLGTLLAPLAARQKAAS
jgi:pyruvate,water dikinase